MWIYEHKDWPNFSWDNEKLAALLAEVRHKQGRLIGRMEGLGLNLKREASLNTLTADVITSSAIEGEVLNPEEVRSSLAKRLGIEIPNPLSSGREVDGIVEMLLDATQKYDTPLTEERLFDWYACLFPTGRSGLHRITVGAWRPEEIGSMQVVSGPLGRERIHFEAPAASRLREEMSRFLNWLETPHAIDPVLQAGIAHLWFVTLHPFEDGNGRIARAIADMMLARSERAPDRFYSMSRQIERERKEYYAHLERQQKSNLEITFWLRWFLECLGRAIEGADEILSSVLYKMHLWNHVKPYRMNERQALILNKMLEGFEGPMSTSKYAKIIKCSPDTALRDIQELLQFGIFIQNPGAGRSTSYRLIALEELKKKEEPNL